jgi:uncharacterized membrane protein YbaN (DUF454 family)
VAALGLILPLLPTVPFLLVAAFFFSKGSPRLEAWLLEHRKFGPLIKAWRESGSISRTSKRAAYLGFVTSAVVGFLLLPMSWQLLPAVVGSVGAIWIYGRPEP